MNTTATDTATQKIWSILNEVSDPEIPVLTVLDMGIIRDVMLKDDEVEIFITPTYSGCPAVDAINIDIRLKLAEYGYKKVKLTQVLSPAWTTDWMSESGKEKLQQYGIAPPASRTTDASRARLDKLLFSEEQNIECPRCHSHHTSLLSQFGSTACKALYQCDECKEPFDYFKCH